ncbi:uncharacterized protein ACA1_396230 [Acanthamoeba castellanii str. Neff]|uniref:Uncharacterized protein n=1 Tax=Acanthamoeba castellanii (strain ATCC 30010 / Neff) TaxID=1257118 RepID=L8HC72_ACACF|nr:uncharacterized protein ACA1_396230 [Acanthamoeba castellanii str. Neff]ELR22837.1 hypothetical protein ACA1_396230 [Acanthamoeba castellanii str. Neff]
MQLNHLPKRKFDDYTSSAYPPHPQATPRRRTCSLHNLLLPAVAIAADPAVCDCVAPVAGKAKKPRKKREKAPRKERKKKKEEEEAKPKVPFRGSRFELWLETRFEEELLKLLEVPFLELSANLLNGASWAMTRSAEERIYKDKWRKRYHVYSAAVGDLVADAFNFHIRTKNLDTGEYNKLPFITPDKALSSQLSSYSSYLSLLGGARINPGEDHSGYPPGELAGEDACTLYEGSDVSFVLVGHLAGPNPAAANPAAAAAGTGSLHLGFAPAADGHQQSAATLQAAYTQAHHLQHVPTDGNHP